MKNYIGLFVMLMFIIFSPANAMSGKYWLMGKVKGNARGNVITVQLVSQSGETLVETSTNKFGFFAFSDLDKGSPSQYKLMVYSGDQFVKQVSLKGVRSGGNVPVISFASP